MDYLSVLTLRLENCPKFPELDRQDYMELNLEVIDTKKIRI